MNANSQLQFVGCVSLRLPERTFQINRNLSRASTIGHPQFQTGLEKLLAKFALQPQPALQQGAAVRTDLDGELGEPLNHDGRHFACPVTGACFGCASQQAPSNVCAESVYKAPHAMHSKQGTSRQVQTAASSQCKPACLPAAGMQCPLAEAHTVTIKQLLQQHYAQSSTQSTNTARKHTLPDVVKKALPGIRAREFNEARKHPLFPYSRVYVCEAAAIQLLKLGLEV